MTEHDLDERAKLELELRRLQHAIYDCTHCAVLREQYEQTLKRWWPMMPHYDGPPTSD